MAPVRPPLWVRICLGAAAALYPFLVYLGIKSGSGAAVGALALLLGLGTLLNGGRGGLPPRGRALLGAAALAIAAGAFLLGELDAAKIWPIAVTLVFLAAFAGSLRPGSTPVVERIAALTTPPEERDDFFRRYCRAVTLAWCGFFALNGLASLATALWGSDEVWALYNGFVSYLLMGAMFAGEYAVRTILRRKRRRKKEPESDDT